jgi:phasin family protein
MYAIPEQFSEATKTNFDALVSAYSELSSKAFECFKEIVALNMSATKNSLEESTNTAQQLLATKDPQEFFSLSAAQAQPNAEKALAYGRHLATIASATQAEFTKATEAQIAATNRKVIALIEEVTKNAPAGSENVIALVKSTIDSANASYGQLTRTGKQAADAFEMHVTSAVNQMTKSAAEKTGTRAKK